jgi:MFS family permease
MTAAVTSPPARDQFRRLTVLIATSLVDMIGFAIVLPLLPFYALKLHATAAEIGIIIAAFSAAQILSAPLWGRVSDTYGRRPALMIGLLASALAYVVFGLADSIWLLLLSRIVQGAGGGTTGVAQAYVADTIEPSQRARALGWLSAATGAGFMVGPLLGSLASHFGQEAPGFIAAGLCVVNAAFAWKWLPESRRKDGSGAVPAVRKPVWHTAAQVVLHPGRITSRLIWIYAVGMLAFSALTAVLSLYLGAEFATTERSIGKWFFYIGALQVVIRVFLLGPIVDRIGETWAMRAGTIALILGLFLFPVPRDAWLLAAIIPFVPVGTALLFPATTSLLSRHVPRSEYGTMMGVAQTFAGIARIIAPVIATNAFQYIGHAAPFYMAGGVVTLVGLLAFQVKVAPHTMQAAPASAPDSPS